MIELLEHIVRGLVDHPDDVKIREIKGAGSSLLEIMVNDNERGMIVGRDGIIIKSIRTIIHCAAMKRGQKVAIEIVE